ncbi:MAG: DUF726 domain-containing protein [Candidatus Hydrogenedentes bacterium]|nr:DUF726 domain-containing protein [Candidatus Hydrogenedentota bacterium]
MALEQPSITPIAKSCGDDRALVIVKGYLSEKARDPGERWPRAIREAGWQGAVYRLSWNASHTADLMRRAMLMARFGRQPHIAALLTTTSLLNHWVQVRRQADHTGAACLRQVLDDSVPEPKVVLMGHSLGARLICSGLQGWHDAGSRVQHVVLLGGAVPGGSETDWQTLIDRVPGRIVNVYNRRDWALTYLYRIGQLTRGRACGASPIDCAHPRIINVDVTRQVGGSFTNHIGYLRSLETALGGVLETKNLPE